MVTVYDVEYYNYITNLVFGEPHRVPTGVAVRHTKEMWNN